MRLLAGHPNVVQLHEVYEDRDSWVLVMEMCSGGELFDRIINKVRAAAGGQLSPGRGGVLWGGSCLTASMHAHGAPQLPSNSWRGVGGSDGGPLVWARVLLS